MTVVVADYVVFFLPVFCIAIDVSYVSSECEIDEVEEHLLCVVGFIS